MPRYQYACPDCGNGFEAQQKFIDKPLKKCPTCGKRNIYRVVGRVAVAFKGTGFYINDSKNSADKNGTQPKTEETKADETKPVEAASTTNSDNAGDTGKETKAEAADTKADVKPAEATSKETKEKKTEKGEKKVKPKS